MRPTSRYLELRLHGKTLLRFIFSRILTDTPGKMFELISGHTPFTDLVPETSSLVRDWIQLLGDLPKEWGVDSPPEEEYGMF